MFAKAYELASKFTHPVIISSVTYSGEVGTSIGAYVLVNKDGWILTAAHIFNIEQKAREGRKAADDAEEARAQVLADKSLRPKVRDKRLRGINAPKDAIKQHSFWWGADGIQVNTFTALPGVDLAVAKLENFTPADDQVFPTFYCPKDNMLSYGRSLCRLGFPFHSIAASFDADTQRFTFAPGSLPLPRFPIDGILTRELNLADEGGAPLNLKFADKQIGAQMIETSSPGLMGQSGGPIFDVAGRVWGIQSRTNHLPLGFAPTVIDPITKRTVTEHQFLHVGVGAHPKVICEFLDGLGVPFAKDSV